jgi:hypothetical protein
MSCLLLKEAVRLSEGVAMEYYRTLAQDAVKGII